MASFSAINTRFNPLSFDDFRKPIEYLEKRHDQMEEAYGNLEAQAATLESRALAQEGSRAAKDYMDYANLLKQNINDLAYNGLTSNTARSLMGTRSMYNRNIVPIAEGFKRWDADVLDQQKGRQAGLLYENDASKRSIDDYVYGQATSNSVDTKQLLARSQSMFSDLSKRLNGNYGKGTPLDNFTDTFIQGRGLTEQDVTSFINKMRLTKGPLNRNNLSAKDQAMFDVFTSLIQSTGVSNWDGFKEGKQAENLSRIANTILEGATKAIGVDQVQLHDNYYNKQLFEQQLEIEKLRQKHAIENPNMPQVPLTLEDATYNSFASSTINKDKPLLNYNFADIGKTLFRDSNGNIHLSGDAWKQLKSDIAEADSEGYEQFKSSLTSKRWKQKIASMLFGANNPNISLKKDVEKYFNLDLSNKDAMGKATAIADAFASDNSKEAKRLLRELYDAEHSTMSVKDRIKGASKTNGILNMLLSSGVSEDSELLQQLFDRKALSKQAQYELETAIETAKANSTNSKLDATRHVTHYMNYDDNDVETLNWIETQLQDDVLKGKIADVKDGKLTWSDETEDVKWIREQGKKNEIKGTTIRYNADRGLYLHTTLNGKEVNIPFNAEHDDAAKTALSYIQSANDTRALLEAYNTVERKKRYGVKITPEEQKMHDEAEQAQLTNPAIYNNYIIRYMNEAFRTASGIGRSTKVKSRDLESAETIY